MNLDKITANIKTGDENLTFNNKPLAYSLLDFWRWSVSDLLSNATRGRLAEFIVATATNIDKTAVRDEWSAYDLETHEGIKIEVKSAAYIQSWSQKVLSKISFSTKAAHYWDELGDKRSSVKKRSAEVYVFCLLHHNNKQTIAPLNLNHWEFYVLATKELDEYQRSQHSITLKSLIRLTCAVSYVDLRQAIFNKYQLNQVAI